MNHAETVAEYCKANLNLAKSDLPFEYYYRSLPLCVIDAVFSVGVRYTSTQNTIGRFARYAQIECYSRERLPAEQQMPVAELVAMYTRFTLQEMAEKVYQNRQRTSPRVGILKAEAVRRFAEVLLEFNVNYLQDVDNIIGNPVFETKIAKIPGQRSGISTRYFYMLAGSDDYIKPDRMISRFVFSGLQVWIRVEEMQLLFTEVHQVLVKEFPQLTPRALDYLIWEFQRYQNPKDLLKHRQSSDIVINQTSVQIL